MGERARTDPQKGMAEGQLPVPAAQLPTGIIVKAIRAPASAVGLYARVSSVGAKVKEKIWKHNEAASSFKLITTA